MKESLSSWLQYEISSIIIAVHSRYEIMSVIDIQPLIHFHPIHITSVLVSMPTLFILFSAVI